MSAWLSADSGSRMRLLSRWTAGTCAAAPPLCPPAHGRSPSAPTRPPAHPADLGGVLDFTGELGRLAIAQATRRDEAAVQRARDLTESIIGQFLRFDLRNGALR